MEYIYCDNGSTSFPKAPGLGKVIGEHIDNNGYNISRGGYLKAYNLEAYVIEAKETICRIFGWKNPKNVVFTAGATMGLNMIINGILKNGDHIITTSMEHNAVVRPLFRLLKQGITWDMAKCDYHGCLDINDVKRLIKPETKMILAIHGSNVNGTLMPIKCLGKICKENNIFFCVDASQTAGSVPIDMIKCNINALVFPGHKSLLGPQGIGGIIIEDKMASSLDAVFSGGTGSVSHIEEMPEFLPDKFQPGTLNIPGIVGIKHAIDFIEKEGMEALSQKKSELAESFLAETLNMNGIQVVGPNDIKNRCPVISMSFNNIDNAEAAYELENNYHIMTRCGLHCAPYAHKTLNTYPHGTVRFSFGYFNTLGEVKRVVDSVNKVIKGHA